MTAAGDALVDALGRFAEILRRGDASSAETVEINENANDGSNEPARQIVESEYQLQGGYDGVFWDVCGIARTRAGLARMEWRCPHAYHRIVHVAREVIEVLPRSGHA
ncbi:MAG: hypothetical protein ABFE07_16260 [Armatimonadia bacterium]